jgi:hypothetical protein
LDFKGSIHKQEDKISFHMNKKSAATTAPMLKEKNQPKMQSKSCSPKQKKTRNKRNHLNKGWNCFKIISPHC